MSKINRREFVTAVGAAAASLVASRSLLGQTTASAPVKRPNILLIMSDEHDPAITACYGDKVVRTPNLDRLAAEGITFDAAYTTSPLCVPARLSFTAGKYASRCGAWSNNSMLPSDDYPSLPRILGQTGYQSYLAGKMHYDATHRYGFTELYPAPTNHNYMTGTGQRRDPENAAINTKVWQDRVREFRTGEQSSVMSHDRRVTSACVDFLENRKADDKPFFLLAGYLAPHFPLTVPQAYYEHYQGKVAMPTIPEGFLESLPTNYKMLRAGLGAAAATPEQTRLGRELYWGFVEWTDGQIGQLLAALQRSSLADNTIVICTSDHGENKGDHGMWWKNCMYEQAARIPLIVRWPKRWRGGQRRPGACSLVDLTQTIAQLAGAKAPADWDGDSLVMYMDNARARWKDLAVSEYYGHSVASGFAMIRQGTWKYVYHTRMNETTCGATRPSCAILPPGRSRRSASPRCTRPWPRS
jgi:choline-sulfatase